MIIYVGIVVVGLIVLGDSHPKIALSIAALILLGTILFNTDKFTALLGMSYGGGGGGRSGREEGIPGGGGRR
jgi:hypothetical protein